MHSHYYDTYSDTKKTSSSCFFYHVVFVKKYSFYAYKTMSPFLEREIDKQLSTYFIEWIQFVQTRK